MFEQYKDNFQNRYEELPNNKIFRITFDPVVNQLKLTSNRQDLFKEIQEVFSVNNFSRFFSLQYGYNAAPRLYQINKFGYFSSGLVFDILSWIKSNYGSLDCLAISKTCMSYINDILTPLKKIIKENGEFEISNIADDLGRNNELRLANKNQYQYRDYQEDSIKNLLFKGYGRGLIQVPTAGGKSFIIANFIWNCLKNINRKYKTLILVPNTQLVDQFYGDLLDYGYEAHLLAKFKGGMKAAEKKLHDINAAKIVIANRQYIFKNEKLLPKFDILFCDEVHQCNSDATKEFINKLDCRIKVGCSGTLPQDKFQLWNLIGMFGKVVFKEEIKRLQDEGFISKLKITLLKIKDKVIENDRNCLFNIYSTKKYRPDENGFSDIMFNDAVNAETEYFAKHYKDLYKPVLEYVKSLNSNTLILFDRIEIGQNLFEYAKEIYQDKNVYYIDGSIDADVREQIRTGFENCDGNLLFAQSAVFSTGISIKRLTNLIFLTGSKSYSRVVQSIGRILRLHESKNIAHLIDISWNFKYSKKHLDERLQIYMQNYHKKYDEIIFFDI